MPPVFALWEPELCGADISALAAALGDWCAHSAALLL